MLIFKGDYDKKEFYSLMGKFFAEREYKRLMPYLVNKRDTNWYIEIENNEVVGFISFIDKSNKINIGYCYVSDEAKYSILRHNLITLAIDKKKDIYAEIEKSLGNGEYLQLGFEIYKETANYWYLVRRAGHESLCK